ncbi:MAG TPA: hypothetical protein RMH85_08570 [Polyangiaceae bacterium LLY-WYZ-15_(1-7)]|nr:hypothetical protein [Sandaracinus sp.]HJK92807.1 hypothetical protein [Polyangiaceae bacterium LLY-WYZ-15_(1-7)]MBJ72326.1 hypothetical protein [Sandaracinus sp.]HJL01445.1 hypothetical protein [Polyangiaceae bacterium LLY-WYZ-15_(1-7)]HJL08536.1 hypothetical protein [Polyangiaceae bacterium LLY-WYZ-15_(1-7)]
MSRRVLALAAALLLGACADGDPARVLVVVEAEPSVAATTRTLVVQVFASDEAPDEQSSLEVGYQELPAPSFPVRVLLRPDQDDARRRYRVLVRAFSGPAPRPGEPLGAGFVAETRVVSGYVEGETRVLTLRLLDACIGVPCEADERCDMRGVCVEGVEEDPETLPGLDGGMPGDAGVDGGCPASCDDGVACTEDRCVAGSCENVPNDALCDDGEPCTDDVCRAASGCQTVANDAPCDDGVYCNGADQCAGGSCSAHEGEICSAPTSCDEARMACVGCTTPEDCTNGRLCEDGACLCPGGLSAEASCTDGADDDCDGMVDCADRADCERAACGDFGRACIEGSCRCPGTREICGEPGDEDCDGNVDEGCMSGGETRCGNGADDDMDGATDCEDAGCEGFSCGGADTACERGVCCDYVSPDTCGGGDEDCDGTTDEDCAMSGDEVCTDGSGDEDGDGFEDCGDLVDCPEGTPCGFERRCVMAACMDCGGEAFESDCSDGFDDDCDGMVDCGDIEDCDCVGSCGCSADAGVDGGTDGGTDGGVDAGVDAGSDAGDGEDCANGIDDDVDGATDCGDVECAGRACLGGGICDDDGFEDHCVGGESTCGNFLDDDADGLTDCADPDCFFQPGCGDGGLGVSDASAG